MELPVLTIDSSLARTELCEIGAKAQTDKSPYNTVRHRHPYTAVYTMLLAQFKNMPVHFAEIGIASGASAIMWDRYFRHDGAHIHMFDRDANFCEHADEMTGDRVTVGLMDVGVDGDVRRALLEASVDPYDVIIDDSSHEHGHQIRIIKEAFPLLRQGGLLIVEDIFRSTAESEYTSHLEDILPLCSTAYFVLCEHKDRWSPGWDNDKMLVLVKG
jgi:predicted O-methyltransferase YrrM